MSSALAAILAVTFWSTNALCAKFALQNLTVLQILVIQFSVAALSLTIWRVYFHGVRSLLTSWPTPAQAAVGVIGLTGTIFLQYFAFDLGNILEANVIAYAWPLFVAVWAAWSLRNMQGWVGLVWAGIGFVGVLLIFDAQGDLQFSGGSELGYLVAVASALCMAFYTVASARIHVQGDQLLIPATVVGALIAFALSSTQDVAWPSLNAWWAAVYIGVGPMAAGFFLWTYAMSGDGAKSLAPIGFATPLFSTMLLLVSGEDFTTRTMLGAAMVLVCSIGVLVTERIWRGRK